MTEFITDLKTLLLRDLAGLERELELYPDDASVWREVPGQPNVAGTLTLHLAGNLQHYLGAVLGHTGYLRDREAEFSRRDVPRQQLCQEIAATRQAVQVGLEQVTEARLEDVFPEKIAGSQLTVQLTLLHLTTHLAYHLGQVDYHRRAVTGNSASAGSLSVPAKPA